MIDTSSVPAVPATLWALGAFSAATWTLILFKAQQYLRLRLANRRYRDAFWAAPDLAAAAEIHDEGALARLGAAAFKVLQDGGVHPAQDLESAWDRRELLERSLRRQIQSERRALEGGLAVLASIGSTAPFVGLFGTVWGIMNALTHIGAAGSVSLEAVAGPIGEALIATGFGIAAAVPAVLGYNFFLRRLKLIVADLDDFAGDLFTLAQRSGFRINATASRLAAVSATAGPSDRADAVQTTKPQRAYA